MSVLGRVADHLSTPGRMRRRSWLTEGRMHVEVRGLGAPGSATLARRARAALENHPGVAWAAFDLFEHRVLIAFDPDRARPDELVQIIEAVEAAAGVSDMRFAVDRPDHPADHEHVTRHALALGADVAGIGLVGFGRLLRSTPLPVEAAAVVTLIDNEPRLRRFLESHLGTAATDLGLAVTNAAGQGLTQGPLGVVVDGIHRANLLAEAAARRRAWASAEERRFGDCHEPGVDDSSDLAHPSGAGLAQPQRRVPLPGGPIERFADRSALAGVAGAAASYATTGSPRRAAAALIAGVPKAARLGREAFAAHLDRALSARDVVVLDATALRRLDRVDTVVIHQSMVRTGRFALGGIRLLHEADALEVHRHLAVMFDPLSPSSTRTRGRWTIGPSSPSERRQIDIRRAERELGATVVVLRAGGHPEAVAAVDPELSMAAVHTIRAARRQGHMVAIAGADARFVADCGADMAIAGGGDLAEAIAVLQQDGCVVALVAPGGSALMGAHRTADVSLELCGDHGHNWAGDIILNEPRDAAFVIDAIGSARLVSRQSVALSASGSGIGALLSLSGLPGQAAGRASGAVNAAALLAIGNGIRAARYVNRHGGRVAPDEVRWHQMEVEAVAATLASTVHGLPHPEATRRHHDNTTNAGPSRPSLLNGIVAELANPLTPVLIGGAAASAAVGSPADAAIVAGVTALNTLIGGTQRYGAERAIRSLSEQSAASVTVRRPEGLQIESIDRLVPGDVVVLGAGDAVPADCRVLETTNLEVDESPLTGESETVGKDSAPTFSAVLAERTCMLYEGTTVAAGEVAAMVVAVGENTAANAMANDTQQVTATGGVEARLRRLTSLTLPVAAAGGAAVMGLGVLRGHSINTSVGSAVALAVAAVPEGLPLLATMAQLASARRLSQRQALVRNPRAIEALGRVKVLCTDKTGTLTEGRIRLRLVSDGRTDVALADLAECHRYTVAAGLRASPIDEASVPLPHLTDRAVVQGARRCGINVEFGAPGWARRGELPFEPARGFHAVAGALAKRSGGNGPAERRGAASGLLSVKGAPEVIIPRCRRWQQGDTATPMTAAARRALDHEVDRLAQQGLRVLAVAERHGPALDVVTDNDVTGLTLLGFLVLSDPVRPTAAQAVTSLRAAGVEVVMVTGDHPSTAEGIAVELGILNGHRVVTGTQLQSMNDRDLDAVITGISVFARVTPADKVRIVSALQRRGQAVAMTGDGANDAPAIRLADVGIALGAHATPAARRAADVVVVDDRIETIVDAIIEGRAMWASVREALAILLGGNLGEVAFTVAATAVTGQSPLSARQLLAVNLLTDVAPALAIAMRPPPHRSPEALVAEGPDASLGDSLERAIVVRAASTALGAGTAWTIARLTGRRQRASTTALVALVGSQLGQTVTSGGLDPLVLLAGGGSAMLLAVIVQTPGVSQFFDCTPLGPIAWTTAIGSAVLATAASVVATRTAPQVSERSVANTGVATTARTGGPVDGQERRTDRTPAKREPAARS